METELQGKLAQLRTALLRISGAIQVIDELLDHEATAADGSPGTSGGYPSPRRRAWSRCEGMTRKHHRNQAYRARRTALDQPGRGVLAAMMISASSRKAPWPPWAAHTIWAFSRTSAKASPGQADRPASAMASRSLTSSPM
jgi:hypothetical protein